MFAFRRVKLVAAAAVASGVLAISAAPLNAQALRLGMVDQSRIVSSPTETVAWRGGGFRGGGMRAGGMRMGGARFVGPRMGGARFVGPRVGGPRFVAAGVRRPGWAGRPGWVGRPVVGPGRPGWAGRPIVRPRPPGWAGGPGWGRPGWRPPPGAWGPGRWRPGWGWWRPGWGWGYYNNTGAWIALGVASAVAVGAVANSNALAADDVVAYCMQRFRSYNPATGTYTGYDGFQHPCP